MKRIRFSIVAMLFLVMWPFIGPDNAEAFIFDGLMEQAGLSGGSFDVYGNLGFQRMSINLNVPVPPTIWGAESEDIDVKMTRQDFAIGSLGIRGLFAQRFGLFAEATVSAENSGSVGTFTSYSYWHGNEGPLGVSWDTRGVRYWVANLGGWITIRDSVVILVGYKFDRLAQKLSRPRELYRPDLFGPNYYDYLGDLNIQTWAPYFGFRFDDGAWRFDLIWSPWLTSYKADMPLVWINFYDNGRVFELNEWQESRYGLEGRGGNLLEAYGETRFNFVDLLAAKLWAKASWLNCRGDGDRVMTSDDLFPMPPIRESQSATGSLTRYLWALGIAGDITF